MKNMIERYYEIKVPEDYDLTLGEIEELEDGYAKDRWDLFAMLVSAYNAGFERGRAYKGEHRSTREAPWGWL